jgi:two-component system NtrC family sensor kinase
MAAPQSSSSRPDAETRLPAAIVGIADAAVDAAIVVDRELGVLHVNRAFSKLAGIRPRELRQKQLKGACHSVFGLASCKEPEGCLGLRAQKQNRPLRLDEMSTGDGRLVLIVTAVPLTGEDGKVYGVLETYRDVTAESRLQAHYKQLLDNERRQKEILQEEVKKRTRELSDSLEELRATRVQLIQSEKMSSLGQLVAGIAHELNNPTNFIYGNMDFLEEHVKELLALVDEVLALDLPPEARVQLAELVEKHDVEFVRTDLVKLVRAVRSGAERVATIIRDLRVFSHLGEADFKECDLNQGIETTLNLIASKAKGRVAIVRELGPLPLVTCNGAHVNQVVMNLVANAIDAIPQKGTVTVRTRAAAGDTIVVEVQDDGTGIEPKVIEKIFDPFFTTKEVGKGTGLGLSISFGIVKAHKGTLEVESEPGAGALFRLSIPVKPPK